MKFNRITFSSDHNELFYTELKQRVNHYFKNKNISKHANAEMVFKTVFMLVLYLLPLCLLFVSFPGDWVYFLCWTVMGFGMAGVGLSVMHDANHGTYSKNQLVNKIIGKVLIFLGGSDVNWRIQHNVLHHTYTNITEIDEDISPPAFLLRFSPHKKHYAIHRFQHLYAWFLYGLMTLMWFFTKDYIQAIRYYKKGLLKSQGISLSKHLFAIVLNKMTYAFVFIVLPIVFSPATWYVTLIGFFVMQFICGFILSVIFQPAHVVPSSNFPVPNDSGNIEADWAVNQLVNTANFAPKSRIFSWYVGGLNYQIEHHLFPNICHIHYRKISKIVENTAKEFRLPYHSYKTFLGALVDHGKVLYALGKKNVAMV
ncbi:MAG: acyl-CoA desaturase [Bacteroidetes bacterium]|nr:acyl-CoA desaturase [Bacteroidota bacterium]